MSKREHISLKTKLASALLTLGHVDYAHAKGMTEDQIISLYHWDHGILYAIEPNDSFWNLVPTLISEHREKSKRDTAIVAKSKRIVRKRAAHHARMGASTDSFADLDRAMGFLARKRRIPSRPFPKIKRPMNNNKRANKLYP